MIGVDELLDGASRDIGVSGDAMRIRPDLDPAVQTWTAAIADQDPELAGDQA